MPRPTKETLIRSLQAGERISYRASSNKATQLHLATPENRSLFKFLLKGARRNEKNFSEAFLVDLWTAYLEASDENSINSEKMVFSAESREYPKVWRIKDLTTKGFGGINLSDGKEFHWNLDGDSWLLDGENGSGKTSILGAVVWAFSGRRPRDDGLNETHRESDVLDGSDKKVGAWPPLAAYPSLISDLFGRVAEVEVTVSLVSEEGDLAEVRRSLKDGNVNFHCSPIFQVDDVFISTSISMPTILPSLRLRDGESALTRAVAQLIGLDELVQVGELADELSHASREYLSFGKKSGLTSKLAEFKASLDRAKEELALVQKEVPKYETKDAVGTDGSMVRFGLSISESAISLTDALSKDLIEGTDARDLDTQRSIIVALAQAKEILLNGLPALEIWKQLGLASDELSSDVAIGIQEQINKAKTELSEAVEVDIRQQSDSRFRLKASAAAWHLQHHPQHGSASIESCPLCEQALKIDSPLRKELEQLQGSKESSQLTLRQSLLQIQGTLTRSVPPATAALIRRGDFEPREALRQAVRKSLGRDAIQIRMLKTVTQLVEVWLEEIPTTELLVKPALVPNADELKEHLALRSEIRAIEGALALVTWFRDANEAWLRWWERLVSYEERSDDANNTVHRESTLGCVERLINATDGAKPFSRAVDHLRYAIRVGREYESINAEQRRREKVVEAIAPLKQLPALAQSVAKDAIEGLSGRIKAILDGMHIAERFQYQNATLSKREGLVVRGSFKGDLRIDVSLVANTSWLRSTLWAFIFALRQEAVEQHGHDPFPVWLFDDPQLTFDLSHRLNWSSYVSALKNGPSSAQVIITTHDEAFAARLRQSDLAAREATIKGASVDSGQMLMLEGSRITRYWEITNGDRASNEKATQYIEEARIFFEGMLKAMLAGYGADILGEAPSALIQRVDSFARAHQAPWDKPCFAKLVVVASPSAIKNYLNEAHHTSRTQLTHAEASAVNAVWPKLSSSLTQCFREVRDYRLLHGMPSAFQLVPSSLEFPDGLASVVKQQRFEVLGKASAFSGRVSEGTLNYQEYSEESPRGFRLGQHDGYRLCAKTLEPVARLGDILLVHQSGDPSSRSLVVAIVEEKILARRFVISDASSDVAVLTANALDPYEIAPPVVARKETLKLRRIVGVLFGTPNISTSEHEIQPCEAEVELTDILSRSTGLVLVSGQSAQPLALDGQYLLVGKRVKDVTELSRLDGRPVIALDSAQQRFFKRLRLLDGNIVVLESLDGGGDYPPELLSMNKASSRWLEECWEVLGVLFELPS